MHANKKLKIVFWNAQSINNPTKKHLLELFMESEKIDIVLLAETFLKPHIPFQIRNFTVHRNDRIQQGHGGVAIANRSSINHKLVSSILTQHIETLTIEILVNNNPIKISVAYNPRASIHFKDDIRKLTDTNDQFMIFGDFNAHHQSWNCHNMNTSGKSLYELHQNSGFIIYNTNEHTHYPHSGRTPSTIDLLLSNSGMNFDLRTHHDHFMSDHAPIICSTGSDVHHTQQKIFDYSKANWGQYRRIINEKIHELPVPNITNEIDIAFEQFTNLIQTTKFKCVPVKSEKIYSPITANTKQLIQTKNTTKRRWQRCMNVQEKVRLKSELNRLQKAVDFSVSKRLQYVDGEMHQTIFKGIQKYVATDKTDQRQNRKSCYKNKN